jgi:hypothetical protein
MNNYSVEIIHLVKEDNIVRLNFVDSGNYETINIIHNKPSGIIS